MDRLHSWTFRNVNESEAERVAALMKPPVSNPSWMYDKVKIRRISEVHGFLIDGRPVKFGETVTTTEMTARALITQGKAERV